MKNEYLNKLDTNTLASDFLKYIAGLIFILGFAFIILQFPIFKIDWFIGLDAVYFALLASIIMCICLCYIYNQIFSFCDALIFSAYLIWLFMISTFICNMNDLDILYNIIHLIIGLFFLALAFLGAKKYWTEKMSLEKIN